MRPPVDEPRLRQLARELGRIAREPVRVYLTGGSTAVLERWRESTIDVDLRWTSTIFCSPTARRS